MVNNPMSPEMVRIVHERQLKEAADRRANRRQLSSSHRRPALRQSIGIAIVRLGRAVANEPIPSVPDVRLKLVKSSR